MPEPPLVSVVMPLFNGGVFLREAMESVLEQTLARLELLVIDDGSTDAGPEIAARQDDPRVRLVRNGRNMGKPFTRNRGISLARGRYVAFLDCDDVACPTRLEKQVAFLEGHPEFGLLGSRAEIIDAEGRATGAVWRYDHRPDEIPAVMLFFNCFVQSAVTLRRDAIPEAGYDARFEFAQDYELWVRMLRRTRGWNLPEVLTRYRLYADSTSRRNSDKVLPFRRAIARQQLAGLGLEATDAELEIHHRLANRDMGDGPGFFDDAERWLLKLLRANAATGCYPGGTLERVLGGVWLNLCWWAAEQGLPVCARFMASPLARPVSWRKRASLAAHAIRRPARARAR
jgi:glycosyltransferase involved in cell wall biosynthesis